MGSYLFFQYFLSLILGGTCHTTQRSICALEIFMYNWEQRNKKKAVMQVCAIVIPGQPALWSIRASGRSSWISSFEFQFFSCVKGALYRADIKTEIVHVGPLVYSLLHSRILVVVAVRMTIIIEQWLKMPALAQTSEVILAFLLHSI